MAQLLRSTLRSCLNEKAEATVPKINFDELNRFLSQVCWPLVFRDVDEFLTFLLSIFRRAMKLQVTRASVEDSVRQIFQNVSLSFLKRKKPCEN